MISYDRNKYLFLHKRQLIVKDINVCALIKISHYKTNRSIYVKKLNFYTQFFITATCFNLSWSSSGSYWISISPTYKHRWIIICIKIYAYTVVDIMKFVCSSAELVHHIRKPTSPLEYFLGYQNTNLVSPRYEVL